MLDQCANPACAEKFHRLTEGRLFVLFVSEAEVEYQSSPSECHAPQYFWLCGPCCRTMTVTVEKGKTVQVVRLAVQANAARAAS